MNHLNITISMSPLANSMSHLKKLNESHHRIFTMRLQQGAPISQTSQDNQISPTPTDTQAKNISVFQFVVLKVFKPSRSICGDLNFICTTLQVYLAFCSIDLVATAVSICQQKKNWISTGRFTFRDN